MLGLTLGECRRRDSDDSSCIHLILKRSFHGAAICVFAKGSRMNGSLSISISLAGLALQNFSLF